MGICIFSSRKTGQISLLYLGFFLFLCHLMENYGNLNQNGHAGAVSSKDHRAAARYGQKFT